MLYINQQFFKLLIFIVVLTCSGTLHARTKSFSTDTIKNVRAQVSDTILVFAEKMPEFPGGLDSLARYINSIIRYPSEAFIKGIGGKVFVQFVINKEGKVLNPKVIKGIGGGCDEEALRVIEKIPNWRPAQQDNRIVSVFYTIPIKFQKPEEEPLTFIEKMPEFPGGENAMMKFIYSSLVYPKEAKQKGICGRVFIQFVVNADGKIKNFKIIKGLEPTLDAEAIRIIHSFPNWNPGRQNGKPVPVYFTLPIVFEQGNCKEYPGHENETEIREPIIHLLPNNPDYKLPEYPGGNDSLYQFLLRNMKFPADAQEKGIGGTVYVQMVVNKTGKIIKPKVVKGVYPSLDTEALRLISLLPNLIPGKRKSTSIECPNYTLEFNFHAELKSNKDSLIAIDSLSTNIDNEEPLTFVDEMPEFPGGVDAMMRFLWEHIRYPKFATEKGITGRVTLQFIIDAQGKVKNVKVLRGIGGGCDEEAIRIVKLMPPWKPGRQNGKIVPVYFTLPVIFQLKE